MSLEELIHQHVRPAIEMAVREGLRAGLVLLFSLVVSGQITLHVIGDWWRIAAVLSQRTPVAA